MVFATTRQESQTAMLNRCPFLSLSVIRLFLLGSLFAVSNGRSLSQEEQNQSEFATERQTDRLVILLNGSKITEFVFDDQRILRPYFSNLRLPNGLQVTRNHPPIEKSDAMDHETMHPGLWLGFGDINGHDFWRNKAQIKHLRFEMDPERKKNQLTFSTECRLIAQDGQPLCRLTNRFQLVARPNGWLLKWSATFHADSQAILFGDQEEMGFGARVATPFTEKNGGRILNSSGLKSASKTWGQPSAWCDYSGNAETKRGGIMLMTSPSHFRESWWHNRDYGLLVANAFGRQAMNQGEKSSVEVLKGQSLSLQYGALVHDGQDIDFEREYQTFLDNDWSN